jgi:hypothetical protein
MLKTQLEIHLALPDGLAREAEAEGLLTLQPIERLLREEVRRRRVDERFETADRLQTLDILPLSEAELDAEIQTARAERRLSP